MRRLGILGAVAALVVGGLLVRRFTAAPRPARRPAPAPWEERVLGLEELCTWITREDPYMGTERIAEHERALAEARAGGDPAAIATALEGLAELLLRHGRNEEAVEDLEEALELVRSASRPAGHEHRILRELGIAHLRRGESDHCIQHHNPQRCLFPIEGDGRWTDTSGAESAIAVFEQLLAARPDDLDVRWLLNVAYMACGRFPDDVPERWVLPPSALTVEDPGVGRFTDVAGRIGLDTFDLAGGVVLDDFDGDGLLDVFTSSMGFCEPARFFRNRGDGTFEDRSEAAGLSDQVGGLNCVQADYDDDGRLDVLIMRGGWQGRKFGRQRSSLLHQRADGSFEDVTLAAGLAEGAYPSQVSVWADYDLDGDLDLYAGNESFPNQLFRNEGDGTFTNVAAAAGVDNGIPGKPLYGITKGAAWGDIDNDGDPDLYVSNYGAANRMFRNEGDGTFTDIAPELRMSWDQGPVDPEGLKPGMTSVIGKDYTRSAGLDLTFATWFFDYDNDGWLDLFVGGFGAALSDVVADYFGQTTSEARRLRLYHNDGQGGFVNVSKEAGIDDVRLPMGGNFGDVDNDGFLDIYLGTGRPPYEYLMPNILYRNIGGKAFLDVTTPAAVGHLQKGHGVGFGDLDNDGDVEIFAQMGGFYPADAFKDAVFENPGNDNHWLTVLLRGERSNRFGVGCRLRAIVATPAGERTICALAGSGGSFGGSSLQCEMGLGDAERILLLEVDWPATGETQSFTEVGLDGFVEVTEGRSELRRLERTAIEF